MQIYTIKIVAGAYGRVPAIVVGYDLTRLRIAKVLFIAHVAQLLHAAILNNKLTRN